MTSRILVILKGNIRYDGRVKKEIKTLIKYDYDVHLIVTSLDPDDSIKNYDYPIYVINSPTGRNIYNSIINKWFFMRNINRIVEHVKPEYIHCNDTTLFYISKWIRKIKVVYDAHELLPEMSSGISKILISYLEKTRLKYVHKVILPQIDRLNYFYFKYIKYIRKDQLYLLENFPLKNIKISYNYFERKYGFKSNKKIMSYVGAITPERKILEVINAIVDIEDLVFFIIGYSTPEYKLEIEYIIEEKKLGSKVFIKNSIPNDEVILVSQSSDIGICFYTDPNLNSYFCASNKLYENLNSGMLVLSNNIPGTVRIIQNGINGYLIDEINETEIKNGIIKLMEIENKIHYKYYWEDQEHILNNIYS